MKWFARRPRDGARPALSRAGAAAWPGASIGAPLCLGPLGYEGQLREAYGRNPVAQRSVKLIAESMAGAPLTASDPALLALVTTRSAGQALIEAIASQLLLHGNAYIHLMRDEAGGLAELYAPCRAARRQPLAAVAAAARPAWHRSGERHPGARGPLRADRERYGGNA